MTTEQTTEQPTTGLAEAMEAAFADIAAFTGETLPERGESTVLYYLRHLQHVEKRTAELRATKQAFTAWLAEQLSSLEHTRGSLDKVFRETAKDVTREKTAGTGRQSHDYFVGACGFRTQTEYEWPDGDAPITDAGLVTWARQNCQEAITETVAVSKTTLKTYIKKTGDEPPMVKVTPGVEKFWAKPAPLALPSEQPPLLGTDQQTTQGAQE